MSNYDPRAAYYDRQNKTQRRATSDRSKSAHPNQGGHDSNYRDKKEK